MPIKFLLNGQMREVEGVSPTTTILQYLRTQEHMCGTKEGCAEGDCGACTVIIGEFHSDQVRYKAVNACILFLPILDGRHLVTVEYLKKLAGGDLNPVQRAMVDHHGSQCGFCTPGFVMALSCLLHNNPAPGDDDIQDAIAGNLCRCTGYRPILDAARSVATAGQTVKLQTDIEALRALQRSECFVYKAKAQKFFAPRTSDELAALLEEHENATLLAGGTDVGLWVTKQHRDIDVLIYTGCVDALHRVQETAKTLEIGAAASHSDIFALLAAYDESMEELMRRFASTQIRNAGTLGGNIANGSPIGDSMPPLIALGTKIVLRSAKESRTLALEDYYLAYGKQDRRAGEFVEKIIVPRLAENALFKTYKLSRRFDQDISAVCAAFALSMEGDTIKSARIAFGGMAATPKRAAHTEEFLAGRTWSEETARAAMETLAQDYTPLTDMRASAEYRLQAAQNLLYRFFLETHEPDTQTRVYRYGR